jgi:hypothetical protein
MQSIKESDWKRFKEVHPLALERYCAQSVGEIGYLLSDKTKTALERFWDVEEATRRRAKETRNLFDDYRRSTALMQLGAMRHRKLVSDEEMARFSAETRETVERMLSIARE